MPHQIIDNRDIKLIDEINKQLDHTVRAKIAVGYFYLSGLKAIREKLEAKNPDGSYRIKEVRLLIGNAQSQLSVEQIAQTIVPVTRSTKNWKNSIIIRIRA